MASSLHTGQKERRARSAGPPCARVAADPIRVLYVSSQYGESDSIEDDRIIATPTLIKLLPPPLRRIIGDLSDTERVLHGLDLPLRPDTFRHNSDGDETQQRKC
jgi:hypothetical protein